MKLKPIFSLFKLNATFLFFGKGLYTSAYLEYTYYGGDTVVYTRSYSDNFSTNNGRVRAAAFGTQLFFNNLAPIYNLNSKLNLSRNETSGSSAANNDSILENIKEREIVLKDILVQIGRFMQSDLISAECFDAKYYFIFPNSIDDELTRSLYSYASYKFCNEN